MTPRRQLFADARSAELFDELDRKIAQEDRRHETTVDALRRHVARTVIRRWQRRFPKREVVLAEGQFLGVFVDGEDVERAGFARREPLVRDLLALRERLLAHDGHWLDTEAVPPIRLRPPETPPPENCRWPDDVADGDAIVGAHRCFLRYRASYLPLREQPRWAVVCWETARASKAKTDLIRRHVVQQRLERHLLPRIYRAVP